MFVEVRERWYAILPNFADPTCPERFRDINVTFDVLNYA